VQQCGDGNIDKLPLVVAGRGVNRRARSEHPTETGRVLITAVIFPGHPVIRRDEDEPVFVIRLFPDGFEQVANDPIHVLDRVDVLRSFNALVVTREVTLQEIRVYRVGAFFHGLLRRLDHSRIGVANGLFGMQQLHVDVADEVGMEWLP